MAGWEDVRRSALGLPESSEQSRRGQSFWRVREKLFVWERPLRASEVRALGPQAPSGPILGARVEHMGAKEALIASAPQMFFTTPHFDGHPSVLVLLEAIDPPELHELIVEAWLARAPKRLAQALIEDGLPSFEQVG
jgi:hypothetical protein